jgi:hypothetical protein
MNFVTKEDASREEIQAVVERGWEAMMSDAKAVTFLIDWSGYHDSEENIHSESSNNDKDEEHNVLNSVKTIEVVEDIVLCPECGKNPAFTKRMRKNSLHMMRTNMIPPLQMTRSLLRTTCGPRSCTGSSL